MKQRVYRAKPSARPQMNRAPLKWAGVIFAIIAAALGAYFWAVHAHSDDAGLKTATLAELQSASERDTTNPKIFYHLGMRLQEAGNIPEAGKAYERAAQLDPDDGDARVALAKVKASTEGMRAAQEMLETFLQKHPNSAVADVALAQLLEIRGLHNRSFTLAMTAAKLDPQNADAWQILGTEATERRDFFTAESALRHAIAIKPDDWHNQVYLGRALLPLERGPEAAAAFREAIRLAPNEALPQLELGKALLDSAATPADYEAARQSLLAANNLPATMPSGGQYSAYFALGKSYERQARWKESLEWLRHAEDLAPDDHTKNAAVHFELARVYQALGDTANAARERSLHQEIRSYLAERIALTDQFTENPNDQATGLKLARLCAARGDTATAAGVYQRLLAQSPGLKAAQQELAALESKRSGGVLQ